ncbi:AAA family ATPase [Nocardia sp. GCM10030253]|uniref:AAA family ATPase n=1 Tax=Nocardia sp. GCM10030253 TaxID=3273404 RepID=UPI00363018A6
MQARQGDQVGVLPEAVTAALDDVAATLNGRGVVVVCGFPGSGKSTAATYLAAQVQAIVLDKDSFAPRLEQDVMRALGGDPFDRDSEVYRSVVSPGVYDGLIRMGLGIGICHPVVLDAPFLSVIREAAVAGLRLGQHLRGRTRTPDSLVVHTIWLDSPAGRVKERMIDRGAERDAPKLADWDAYRSAVLDSGLREIAHDVVDVVISN